MPAALPLYVELAAFVFLQPGPNFNYQHRQSISNEGLTHSRYTSLEHAPLRRARRTNKHITQDHAAVCAKCD
jgi:hypothetical protein